MAFWGVEVRPGKPYNHSFDKSRGRLRISQATLGDGKSESKSTGQCIVGYSSPVSLCTLIPNVSETCHLELEFEEDKEVTFSVLGPRSIHLTGYYPGHARHLDGDDSESYGEDIAESDTSDSCTDGSEEEYESDFIDDDDDLVYADFTAKKSSVVIKEIEDDDKSCEKNHKLRRLKKKHVVSDAEDAETGSKQLAVTNKGSTKEESEDEDGFPIFFTTKSSSKKKVNDDKKSKTVDISEVTVSASEAKENLISAAPETVAENNEKPKKKKKNNDTRFIGTENDKKQNKSNESAKVEEKSETDADILIVESKEVAKEIINGAKDTDNDGVSGPVTSGDPDTCKVIKKKNKKKRTREEVISVGKDLCKDKIDSDKLPQDDCTPIDMKKKTKKNKKKSSDSDINHVTSAVEKADLVDGVDDSQHGSQSNRTRTFPNGLIVEEVSMGKPEGKKATLGKKVSVHYIGKLKNGTIFDSNIGQRPFKFRLGIGEVIKGWDIGINGMRVGDKRKLTIPPSFGYGAKNMGKIPPNSWLLFDVELVDVQ